MIFIWLFGWDEKIAIHSIFINIEAKLKWKKYNPKKGTHRA